MATFTTFSATNLLHLGTHSSKNCSLIFLCVFIPIFSIISPTITPRMMNQFVPSIFLFLHFILTIQLTFFKYFYIFLIFPATPKNLPQGQVQDDIKRPPAENDRRPVPALDRLFYLQKSPAFGEGFHPLLPFNCRPPLHLSEIMPALKKSLAVPAD